MNKVTALGSCEPCKPKKAPVFNLGDVVEHIHTCDVFKINVIVKQYNDVLYAHRLPSKEDFNHDVLQSGHSLKKYTGKK